MFPAAPFRVLLALWENRFCPPYAGYLPSQRCMTAWQKALIFYLAFSCGYGLYGMRLYFPLLRRYPFGSYPGVWLIGLGFLALFAALGLSAFGLWRTRRYSWGTLALQIAQLVGFCLGGYKYQFEAGTSLKWLYEDNRMEWTLKPLTAEFTAGLNLPQEFLYVNLVPLLVIYLLQKHFPPKPAATTEAIAV